MANTITGLIPTLYEALDVVSRELVGFIPAVSRNSSAERAALNQAVTVHVVPSITAADIVPGVTAPNDGDQTLGTTSITITKSRYAPIRWNGEEQKAVGQTGVYNRILRDQFAQAMRTLVNEVETDVAGLYVRASRAAGTAGTTPFGTAGDLSDFALARQILEDNGAATSDLHLVLGSAGIANLRGKQSVLFKVNEAGTAELLREGIVGRTEGFDIHNSSKVRKVTKGTGSGYVVNNGGGYAAGATTIALSTGTGSILAGDVVTFAGDSNAYVVATALAGGNIVLAAPGLQAAVANGAAVTVGNNFTANLAFARTAIQLVTRAPAMPDGGDDADDVMEIVDPQSGLAFQVARYRQYRQSRFEIGLAWGQSLIKPEHVAVLRG